ncbi:hypothetical protein IWZ03DRAFT_382692 [Phyllosticta citriasiana]|uniref:Uncharacterized protein n=1 Tax=Phyllosticta citriasiana TaxID=595635 RepID=A0ABR1KFV4_9PEZI
MQERPTNVEVSTSKSGPKQTSSIHPYARQKDQKKKKTKKNKKEQHKGPLHASKTTNAMTTTTEAHQQVLSEHLSSDNSLSQKDDKIQQVKSHQFILDSRLRNSIPTSQQETHENKLTPKFSIAPESGRNSVVESGSIVTDGLDSTLYATSLSDGGHQSGDKKVEIPQRKDGLGTDQHIMDGEDVWQQSSVTEGAPAGEPSESAGSLRIADHAAGGFQNREETSNAESSRGSLDSAQPSAVEGSETYNSDAADEFLIRLNAKRRANEKTRLKAKAKRDRQRAEKRAQEEQESKLRAADGPQKDPEVYDKRIRVSTPYVSSDDEEDQIEVVQCGTQYEAFRPHSRVASPKDTPHALSGDQKFKDLCSGAIGALQELGVGGPTTSNYAVPALLSESDSSDSLEFCDTATTNSMKAGKEFPHPFPPPTRLNGKVGNQAQSSLDFRGAQCTSSKSQHNERIVDCVTTSSQSSPPSKKQEKRKGKCCAHEMDEPEEATNAPGKPSAPHSFYDDFEIDADKQSESQRDATIPSDPMSPPGEDDAEQARKISQVVAALTGLRALHTVEVSIHEFVGSAGDGTFPARTEGNAEDSGRVEEELEEAGGVQVAKDDGDAAEAAAGGSKRKTSKKKSKKGKKKGRKW